LNIAAPTVGRGRAVRAHTRRIATQGITAQDFEAKIFIPTIHGLGPAYIRFFIPKIHVLLMSSTLAVNNVVVDGLVEVM
jgi:hypothetical protein